MIVKAKGRFLGSYPISTKDGKVIIRGQLLQEVPVTSSNGKNGYVKYAILEMGFRNEDHASKYKKDQEIEMTVEVREGEYNGRKFVITNAL